MCYNYYTKQKSEVELMHQRAKIDPEKEVFLDFAIFEDDRKLIYKNSLEQGLTHSSNDYFFLVIIFFHLHRP